jgi:hypothetical protein
MLVQPPSNPGQCECRVDASNTWQDLALDLEPIGHDSTMLGVMHHEELDAKNDVMQTCKLADNKHNT